MVAAALLLLLLLLMLLLLLGGTRRMELLGVGRLPAAMAGLDLKGGGFRGLCFGLDLVV
jgi:hypothetical protein